MSLAVGLTPLETRREVVLHVATRAESLGYETFFVAEGWGHDASVLLAEVATRTSRIRIGTGVLNVWGRSAAQIAMVAASLQEISGGRFVLGLGAGSPTLAEGLHDVPFRDPVRRLVATTRQVRALLSGERVSPGSGGPGLRLDVGPYPVPITLAALGQRRSGRLAGSRTLGAHFCSLPPHCTTESGCWRRAPLIGRCRRSVPASQRRFRPTRTRPGGWHPGGSLFT
jgi:alkanesulfonate monooxygenase SsuD/methylene tetrahydromethanopterin reductase-like flavin-dependent oxidoreductase (luciferase family)